MRTVLALQSLQSEVSFVAQHSLDEGREHLNDLEIEHLIKMTNDVVMKIKQQTKEMSFFATSWRERRLMVECYFMNMRMKNSS